jgi:hypothetical protein
MSQITSAVGDLTTLAKDLEKVFEKYFKGRPGMAIAFTLPPDYDQCHWVTNLKRREGIKLFADTAIKMQGQAN